jgi:hypothetical protein
MPHDADYYRARAMEERARAQQADRLYRRTIHRQLAEQLDWRAAECDSAAELFDQLAEQASQVIKQRERQTEHWPLGRSISYLGTITLAPYAAIGLIDRLQ